MECDHFVGAGQQRARLASNGEAVRAIRATLETLGERLSDGQAENLAGQLPEEIGFYLNDGSRGERFGMDEFFERVTNKSGVDKPVAVYQAKAVIEVLKEAVTPQLMEKVKEQLPDEFNPLFEAGSTGNLETD